MTAPCLAAPRLWWLLAGALLVGATDARPDLPMQVPSRCLADARTPAGDLDIASLRQAYGRPSNAWPSPEVAAGVAWQELAPLPDPPPAPADNPATPARIALGKRLFADPRLSRSGQIACANCHEPQLGWGDGRSVSLGHDRQAGRRNAIGIAMSAYAPSLFWDGRAGSLEAQVLHPITDAREMAFSLDALERRLNRDGAERAAFARVFGTRRINAQDIARAIASYERSLRPRASRFEAFVQGRGDALNDQELRGLHLFRTRAGCMNCHSGPTLSDNGFHNLGLHFYGRARQDLGRYEVTGDPADSGRFRTPSLRNVGQTGPWMHNGLLNQLREVVIFYNVGGARPRMTPARLGDPLFPRPDPLLQPRGLGRQDIDDLTAFLGSL